MVQFLVNNRFGILDHPCFGSYWFAERVSNTERVEEKCSNCVEGKHQSCDFKN